MWNKKPKIFEEEATIVPMITETKEVKEVVRKPSASVIASQTNINGSISANGDVSVDGNVNGDVSCALFSVGTNGTINGNVTAETATIRGRVNGNVTARTILLAGTGTIEGDLTHCVLIIEEGGVFEGRSKRVSDPLSGETKALEAPVQTIE
ncbi:MAG: polymer-forming cytoskeletal protein [Caulobacterales bacterium]|nr:polymer-forming cytoskeletal protein [Caulobacterales bacterium]